MLLKQVPFELCTVESYVIYLVRGWTDGLFRLGFCTLDSHNIKMVLYLSQCVLNGDWIPVKKVACLFINLGFHWWGREKERERSEVDNRRGKRKEHIVITPENILWLVRKSLKWNGKRWEKEKCFARKGRVIWKKKWSFGIIVS